MVYHIADFRKPDYNGITDLHEGGVSVKEYKMETFYPGQYTRRDKETLIPYWESLEALNRDPVTLEELEKGTTEERRGRFVPLPVEGKVMDYYAYKYDPENPLYTDDDYARKMGYREKIAYPTFAACDDCFGRMGPMESRDSLLVCGVNTSMHFYEPVYAGDTLYPVTNSEYVEDITPEEGSEYRSLAITINGSVYNQNHKKVLDVQYRCRENNQCYAGEKPDKPLRMGIGPDWTKRPAHKYTDADWETIMNLWKGEKRQGAEPLYWEDVNVGDHPTPTCDGPFLETTMPTVPYGMGMGGSRTLKKEILDEETRKNMVRYPEDGIYRMPNYKDSVPEPPVKVRRMGPPAPGSEAKETPKAGAPIGENRMILINFFMREFAVRHIYNWMGDKGWISRLEWGIMPFLDKYGYHMPAHPQDPDFLSVVPELEGRRPMDHGMIGDVAIIKSYVYNKHVKNGKHYVDLAFWMETIDGVIIEEGQATVCLPSKG